MMQSPQTIDARESKNEMEDRTLTRTRVTVAARPCTMPIPIEDLNTNVQEE